MKCLLCLLTFALFAPVQQHPFSQLQQLEGTWKMETARRTIYESWKMTSKTEMAGWSYVLRGLDTVTLEKITLRGDKDGIFYMPAVADQNQGKTITFRLVSAAENKFVFENKEHDFPQRIVYRLVTKDSVHASIAGTKNGAERKSDFYYKRIK